MNYPKSQMRINELVRDYNFPRAYLERAYRTKGQRFAYKVNPMKQNSPIVFEMDKFEEWRLKDIDSQVKMSRREW